VSDESNKDCQQVSAEKLKFLEFIIWLSPDADEFSKRCLICLIRQSEGLSREVCLDLSDPMPHASKARMTEKVRRDFHAMCSSNRTTHVDELFHLAGSRLSVDYSGICLADIGANPHSFVELVASVNGINAIEPVTNPYKD